jgi:homoserine kinase type II
MDYPALLKAWGIEFADVDESAQIEGSPERSARRVVVRDIEGRRWILEQIKADNLARKRQVAETLSALSAMAQIHPYCRTVDGSSYWHTCAGVPNCGGDWMLRSYVDGVPLDRETWLDEPWRLDAMGAFVLRLRTQDVGQGAERFSVADYARGRMALWRKQYSKLAERLESPFQSLEKNFFAATNSLPVAFCHGDFHPLNVVWGDGEIRSVIDWEFCGLKPELYDVALLLGCMGFDEPDHLIGEPAVRLIQTLRHAGFGAAESWGQLIGLVAAIRFGWMSEWIRRGEEDSAEQEAFYIQLLLDQGGFIAEKWRVSE